MFILLISQQHISKEIKTKINVKLNYKLACMIIQLINTNKNKQSLIPRKRCTKEKPNLKLIKAN